MYNFEACLSEKLYGVSSKLYPSVRTKQIMETNEDSFYKSWIRSKRFKAQRTHFRPLEKLSKDNLDKMIKFVKKQVQHIWFLI